MVSVLRQILRERKAKNMAIFIFTASVFKLLLFFVFFYLVGCYQSKFIITFDHVTNENIISDTISSFQKVWQAIVNIKERLHAFFRFSLVFMQVTRPLHNPQLSSNDQTVYCCQFWVSLKASANIKYSNNVIFYSSLVFILENHVITS